MNRPDGAAGHNRSGSGGERVFLWPLFKVPKPVIVHMHDAHPNLRPGGVVRGEVDEFPSREIERVRSRPFVLQTSHVDLFATDSAEGTSLHGERIQV